jgi:hypothetical protein
MFWVTCFHQQPTWGFASLRQKDPKSMGMSYKVEAPAGRQSATGMGMHRRKNWGLNPEAWR